MSIHFYRCPFTISVKLIHIIEQTLLHHSVGERLACNLYFRDPDFSVENRECHPVDMRISSTGRVCSITEFHYPNKRRDAKIDVNLSFDFTLRVLKQSNWSEPIELREDLFEAWQRRFLHHYAMGVYETSMEVRVDG